MRRDADCTGDQYSADHDDMTRHADRRTGVAMPRRALGTALATTAMAAACSSPEASTERAPALAVSPARPPSSAGNPTVVPSTKSPQPANIAAPAGSQLDAQVPVSLVLPGGSLMRVDPVSTSRRGELAIPTNTNRAGWWDGSSKLGEPHGSTVLVGHVDSFEQGLGKFAELLVAQRGDVFTLHTQSLTQRFVVTRAELVPKASLSAESALFDVHGDRRLVLITCGGAYDADLGGYQDNMIVVAEPWTEPSVR